MLTTKEVAKELKVHEQTVRNWIRNGTIKAIKVNRTVRIPKEEIERMKKI